jgi:uncharacterized protein (DUF305 family)
MKKYLLLMSLAAFLSCDSDNSNTANSLDSSSHNHETSTDNNAANAQNPMMAMHTAMSGMMQQMKNMKPTGDPDYDFAMMMKHHHQGAIDMAKAELNGGTDETMKQKAQQIIDDQQNEINQFDRFLQGTKPSGSSDFGQRSMSMMTDMNNMKMEGGSLDAMFASMMIPHHEDAVKMANEYLKAGTNEDIKKIARNIIQTQPKEVQEFQKWLRDHKS